MQSLKQMRADAMVKKILLFICAVYFFLIPSGCSRPVITSAEVTDSTSVTEDNQGVILDSAADVFSEPDIKSQRITQVKFNELVSILENNGSWAKITTDRGITGWLDSKYLIKDVVSTDPNQNYKYMIIITSKEKKISSQIKGGVTIKEVPMGTKLYSRGKIGSNYEVALPGRSTGWVAESGTIQVDVSGKIPLTSAKDFTATAMKFKGTSYMKGGLTGLGIDAPGMVSVCAEINGVQLPADLIGQFQSGTKVDISVISAGDLLFFNTVQNPETPAFVGIYLGNDEFIYANHVRGHVTINSLNEENFRERLIAARRIFPH